MLNTTATNRANYWQQQVTTWQQSGLSCTQFCQQQHLIYHQFLYWRRKLMALDAIESSADSGFTQVCYQSSFRQTTANLSLALANGLVVQDINDHNMNLVRQLLEVLS